MVKVKSKHRLSNLSKKLNIPVKRNRATKKQKAIISTHSYYLSDTDRVIYSYETNNEREILSVVCVSYDVSINNKWITIVYYDSKHGPLHRHMRVSLDNTSDTPTTAWVIKKGKPKKWLTWARKDISKNFLAYRTGFFRRSKIKNLY